MTTKSNDLMKKANNEDNDLKAMGLYTKVMREQRSERFENYKDKIIQAGYNIIEHEAQGKYTIEPTPYGIIDYYPKANKVLIRKDNEWKTAGLRFIINNLLK